MEKTNMLGIVLLLVVLLLILAVGCQQRATENKEQNVSVIVDDTIRNGSQVNQTEGDANTTSVNGTTQTIVKTIVYTVDQQRKLNVTRDLYIDYTNYIQAHDKNLTIQLNLVRNKTIDRIVDPVLQEKLNKLHNNIVSNYSADEIQMFGLDQLLQELYNVDDVLNPKSVKIVNIQSNV